MQKVNIKTFVTLCQSVGVCIACPLSPPAPLHPHSPCTTQPCWNRFIRNPPKKLCCFDWIPAQSTSYQDLLVPLWIILVLFGVFNKAGNRIDKRFHVITSLKTCCTTSLILRITHSLNPTQSVTHMNILFKSMSSSSSFIRIFSVDLRESQSVGEKVWCANNGHMRRYKPQRCASNQIFLSRLFAQSHVDRIVLGDFTLAKQI